jgi:hypothetical protein
MKTKPHRLTSEHTCVILMACGYLVPKAMPVSRRASDSQWDVLHVAGLLAAGAVGGIAIDRLLRLLTQQMYSTTESCTFEQPGVQAAAYSLTTADEQGSGTLQEPNGAPSTPAAAATSCREAVAPQTSRVGLAVGAGDATEPLGMPQGDAAEPNHQNASFNGSGWGACRPAPPAQPKQQRPKQFQGRVEHKDGPGSPCSPAHAGKNSSGTVAYRPIGYLRTSFTTRYAHELVSLFLAS